MKNNPSRYFSRSLFSRLPLYKVVLSGVLALSLVAGMGGSVAYAMRYTAPQAAPAVEAEPLEAAPEPTPEPTPDPTAPPVKVSMDVESLQQSIGVEVYTLEDDPTLPGELLKVPVLDVPFGVTITGEDGEAAEHEIDPENGTLLVEDVEPGDYEVALHEAEGYIIPEPQTVTVKEKVVYKVTAEEIKAAAEKVVQASQVAESAEDANYGGNSVVQEQLTDDVPYAEPSKEVQGSVVIVTSVAQSGQYMVLTDGTVTDYVPVYENGAVVRAERRAAAGAPMRLWLMDEFDNPEGPADSTPTPTPTPTPTATPESTPTATPEATPESTPEATPESTPETTPESTPEATPEATPTGTPEPFYKKWPDSIPASDFSQYNFKYEIRSEEVVVYTGWQTIDGVTYYFSPEDHQPVKGTHVISGTLYSFDNSTGALQSQRRGIDVSKFQASINWPAVKADGIQFAIIRVGYRGYGSGALVEDSAFKTNIRGAIAAGIPVGLYFYSQAVNEEEAKEEAAMVLSLCSGYSISYPIYYDTECTAAGGRADGISAAQRTACAVAFCETIRSAGYSAGVYSYASWFYNNLNFASISRYPIWIAQYRDKLDFRYHYNIWQYSSKGRVNGISTAVDMNIAY